MPLRVSAFGVADVTYHSELLGLVRVLCRYLQQGGWVRAGKVIHLLAVLKEEKGRDGADAELLGEIGDVVGVEADKGVGALDGELFRLLGEHGGDGLAGAAPGGVGLDGDDGGLADDLVELGLGCDFDDFGFGGIHFVGMEEG